MGTLMEHFSINCHSSIRWCGEHEVLRFDPYQVKDTPRDAALVFVTHDHYDHFSPEDIRRVLAPDGFLVLPDTCYLKALEAGFDQSALLPVHTGVAYELGNVSFRAVPAYNVDKPFHPEQNRYLGYVVTMDGTQVYVSGDTDAIPEMDGIRCDVAFLPAGGTYTMTAKEAAAAAGRIRPRFAVPTHYGCIVGDMADGDAFAAALAEGITCVKLIR